MTSKKLKTGQYRGTFYRDLGNGFPVMLLHGFPMDGQLWDYPASRLAAEFRLLIPDLPGSGASPFPEPLTIEEMADLVREILDQEALRACVVIGHSMGGYVTLAFAEKYPDRLNGYGLFHATALADSAEKKRGRLKAMDLMGRYGAEAFLRKMLPSLFSASSRDQLAQVLQSLGHPTEAARTEAMVAYYRAMMNRPDRTAVLGRTQVPVLFVIGKEDTAAPPADMFEQVSLPAVSEVHLLDRVAHMGMMETPGLAAEILEGFIAFCRDFPHFSTSGNL